MDRVEGHTVTIGAGSGVKEVRVGADLPIVLFCGPCVIESRDHTLRHASRIQEIAASSGVELIFKSSYDKANRTSTKSYRGVGRAQGLKILSEVRDELGVAVVTDVHTVDEVQEVASVVDALQIPAFLCRQTDLIVASAETQKPLLIKKGQFLAPQDMKYVARKAQEAGNDQIMLCERGTCFGYRELIVDFRALDVMNSLGFPVIFDATHSVQNIGGADGASSGDRRYVSLLSRASVAAGVNGVFLECHENPDSAPSDGANMIAIDSLSSLLSDLKAIDELSLKTRG